MSRNKIMDNIEMIEMWAYEGVKEKEIARRIGVSDRTLRTYKTKEERVFSALNNPQKSSSDLVEYSLLKLALGYEYEDEELVKQKTTSYDPEGNKIIKEEYVKIKIKKKVKPDVQAQKFWLINKLGKNWCDNPQKLEINKELMELRKKEIENKSW